MNNNPDEPENIIDSISVSDDTIPLYASSIKLSNRRNNDEATETDDEATETDEDEDEEDEDEDDEEEEEEDDEEVKEKPKEKTPNEVLYEYYKLKKIWDESVKNFLTINRERARGIDRARGIEPARGIERQMVFNFEQPKWQEETRKDKNKDKDKYKDLQCVNCYQLGGTLFSNIDGLLKATCGNISTPCNLNIQIQKGNIVQLRDLEYDLHKKMNEYKKNMIILKLDLLFGYSDEEKTIEKFKNNNNLLTENERLLYECHNYLLLMTEEKDKLLNDYNKEFKEHIQIIKELIASFKDKKDLQNITEIVNEYIEKVYPLLEKIRDVKYNVQNVEKIDDDGAFKLIQDEFKVEETEMYIGDKMKVISYDK